MMGMYPLGLRSPVKEGEISRNQCFLPWRLQAKEWSREKCSQAPTGLRSADLGRMRPALSSEDPRQGPSGIRCQGSAQASG